MDTADFLYLYKIDVKERVLSQLQQQIHKKFKSEALKKISPEIVENAVDQALEGYGITTVDLTLAVKHSDVLCVQCGECCRKNDPIVVEGDDLALIASFLGSDPQAVVDTHSKQLGNGKISLRTPCPFLQGNRCSIYPARPKVCRLWPFTIEGNRITMGIQPYCTFTTNFLVEKSFGFLIMEFIGRNAPNLGSAMKRYAKDLGNHAPIKQPSQLQFFKKWVENNHRDPKAVKTFETFSQYVVNVLVVNDFLHSEEEIRYQSPTQVKYNDDFFTLYVTNLRLIAHKRSGLWLFTKDKLVEERLEDIQHISYKEKGLLSKKGLLIIETRDNKILFEGSANHVKTIWRETNQYIRRPAAT